MSLYIFASLILSILTFVSGFFVYQRYRSSSGIFYFIFSCLLPFWYILYIVSFSPFIHPNIILIIYRLQYTFSLIGFYSVVFFILFFLSSKNKIRHYFPPILFFFFSLIVVINSGGYILSGIYYDADLGSYAEIYGDLYIMITILYGLLFPILVFVGYIKISILQLLDRARLLYIIIGFGLFIFFSLTSHVFIPFLSSDSTRLYGEDIFPMFLLPFVSAVIIASYKYDFSGYKMLAVNILRYVGVFTVSFLVVLILKIGIFPFISNTRNTWNISNGFTSFDIIFSIFLFMILFNISNKFLYNSSLSPFLKKIEKRLPFITNDLSLAKNMSEVFEGNIGIRYSKVMSYDYVDEKILQFFSLELGYKYILKDFVFLERVRHRVSFSLIEDTFGKDAVFISPVQIEERPYTFLVLGGKSLGDFYTGDDIKSIVRFSEALKGHQKYLSIYNEIQELSISLDKKVDEKTIEYNMLLNKQKEFIRYTGHEIKNPITNALFLCDSLRGFSSYSQDSTLREEIDILYSELIKVSELSKNIFNVEKYDLDKNKLYKKTVNIVYLIKNEISIFENMNPHVVFMSNFSSHEIYLQIDEVQFRQVITNILTNAIKFSDIRLPKIIIKIKEDKITHSGISVVIEDNGLMFDSVGGKDIFDKYVTGSGDMTGLGMGLYLCKKIIELHDGSISVEKGKELGGARFIINI